MALAVAVAAVTVCLPVSAADKLPPKPAGYVEDQAGILSAQTKQALASGLEQFERDTSNQILVAIYPDVPSDLQMEDFTQRTAESWGVGQAKKNNGAVLFIFPKARKMRIEVGYGLEGAIPDATARHILDNEVRPAFRQGDFNAGVTHGVDAILAAARGEYKGTGSTVADSHTPPERSFPFGLIFFLIFLVIVIAIGRRSSGGRGAVFGPAGRNDIWSSSSSGGSSWSNGSSSGGFDGGGGSFGGGGSSGSW